MFVSFTDKDKKKLYTHTSLVDEEAEAQIKEVYATADKWRGAAAVAGTYVGLELVNRVRYFGKFSFPVKAAIVGGIAVADALTASTLFWKTRGDEKVRGLLNGAPVYENQADVPELDKMYFFLDDDNNYEPSLYHHGITKPHKPQRVYSAPQ